MASYKGWETSTSLLIAYESLALAHKRSNGFEEVEADFAKRPQSQYANYKHAFALLILNASIIEGTLRSIISERVVFDIEEAIQKGIKAGQTSPSKPEQLLSKFLSEIEMQGGWEKLKEQFAFYFDISVDKIASEETKEGINALFVLRNVIAHGTALIQPSSKMSDNMQDVYPYNWQRKLQRASVYLEKHFKKGDIFENLAEYSMPEHFMEVTKDFMLQVENKFNPLPERVKETVDMVKGFNFGYINYTR